MVPDTAADFARYIAILRSQGYGQPTNPNATPSWSGSGSNRGRGTKVTTLLPKGANLKPISFGKKLSPGVYTS